jgi:hypothetical protein
MRSFQHCQGRLVAAPETLGYLPLVPHLQVGPIDRPLSLIGAEALIAQGLKNNPEDAQLLAARGRANLLEWSHEAAITDIQEALDSQKRQQFWTDLTRFISNAPRRKTAEDYGTAFELQTAHSSNHQTTPSFFLIEQLQFRGCFSKAEHRRFPTLFNDGFLRRLVG